ncbi:MAG: hypothetical protein M1836_001229 [Candelina mexicana]|nr:MAG: hypothetical protein M1836_001229 [Candelina mexicana]
METLKAFFQKALRMEDGYVSLLRDLESDGGASETNNFSEPLSDGRYANDEVDNAFESTPLVLQDPSQSNGALARRRMEGNVSSYAARPITERNTDAAPYTNGLQRAPLEAQPCQTTIDSHEEAARLYAMSTINAYTPWAPICRYQTPEACARARAEEYLRSYISAASDPRSKAAAYAHAKTLTSCVEKVHYTIVRGKGMSFEFGDCQYLDQCPLKNAGCTKVHYVKVPPKAEPAVIGVQMLKATKFKHDPNGFDALSPALKKHELCKLIALQKTWETLGRTTPSAVPGGKVKPLTPRSIDVDIKGLDLTSLGKFGVIMVDSPLSSQTPPPYNTLSDVELLNLPFDTLSDEGLLLLWGAEGEIGRDNIERWGYKVMTEIIWIKTNRLNKTIVNGRTGHWLNHNRETCLLGFKGPSPSRYTALLDRDTEFIVAPEREAFHRPDEIYNIIDRLAGAESRKVELFARTSNLRRGWLRVSHHVHKAERISADMEEVVNETGKES